MDTYVVNISEILSRNILVKAKDENEAITLVEEAHKDGKIELDYDDYFDVHVILSSRNNGIFKGTEEQKEIYEKLN